MVGKRIVEDEEALFHTHWLIRDDLSLAFSAKLSLWKFKFLQLVKKKTHNLKGEIWCVAHSLISGLVFTFLLLFFLLFFFQFHYFFFFGGGAFFLAFFNYFLCFVGGRSF